MTLTPLTSSRDLQDGFDMLFENLTHGCQAVKTRVGWHGGGGIFTVHWNPKLRFWSLLDANRAKARFWCCFGTHDPNNQTSAAIVCEANPPKKDFDRRSAGVLLRDDAGHIYLGHSGKIGGGRKGIGKSNFLSFYQGKLVTVKWPDVRESDVIVIGQVDGNQVASQIVHFVHEVEQFKQTTVRSKGRLPLSKLPASFKPEFTGNRQGYAIKNSIIAECDHGLLVSELAKELEKRKLRYGNDRFRDLFVVSAKGRVKILFEAKTDLETASVYGGVGQLLLHGAAEKSAPKSILVVPGTPTSKTSAALKKLGILTLTYKRKNGDFSMGNLDAILR